jgi:hypothetical protein
MKNISRFLEYIVESEEFSKDVIDEYLINIKDLGITYYMQEDLPITKGKYKGRYYNRICFYLSNSQSDIFGSIHSNYSGVIWEFLDEIISLNGRLGDISDSVSIDFNSLHININFLNKRVDTGELEKLYNVLKEKSHQGKSDFVNNMTIEYLHLSYKDHLNEDQILIKISDEYSDRKWDLFTKGTEIDRKYHAISLFDIDKKVERKDYSYRDTRGSYLGAKIKITLKK